MTNLVNNDKRAENRAQQRILAAADKRFSGELSAILLAATEQMIDSFRATGSAPNLPDDFQRQMEQAYIDMAAIMIDVFGARILETGVKSWRPYTVDGGKTFSFPTGYAPRWETKGFAEFFQRLAIEYIGQEAIRRRIAGVTNTTRNLIIQSITRGQENGDSVDVIAAALDKLFPAISRHRGALIARTETHGAANFGADQAAKATGLTLRKEWVAADDARTRDFGAGDGVVDEFSHRAANGQVVDMDQPFRIPKRDGTTEALMFPGDPVGSPGNVIGCRCSVSHIVVE